jgi:hypothetical protein
MTKNKTRYALNKTISIPSILPDKITRTNTMPSSDKPIAVNLINLYKFKLNYLIPIILLYFYFPNSTVISNLIWLSDIIVILII